MNNFVFIRTMNIHLHNVLEPQVYILTELKLGIKRSVSPYIFDIVGKPTIILSSLEL